MQPIISELRSSINKIPVGTETTKMASARDPKTRYTWERGLRKTTFLLRWFLVYLFNTIIGLNIYRILFRA